jgi:hypothetical protein
VGTNTFKKVILTFLTSMAIPVRITLMAITTAENKITGCFSIIRNENDLSIISFYSLLIF